MGEIDISSILSSLSSDDISNLKNMANSILNSNDKSTTESDNKKIPELEKIDLSNLGLPDMSQFSNLLPLISALNSHDEREDFLFALKPLLSEGRQKKTDEAVKFIKLLSLIPLLREKGLM